MSLGAAAGAAVEIGFGRLRCEDRLRFGGDEFPNWALIGNAVSSSASPEAESSEYIEGLFGI